MAQVSLKVVHGAGDAGPWGSLCKMPSGIGFAGSYLGVLVFVYAVFYIQ